MTEKRFAFADELKDAGKFCATFARAKMATFLERAFVPQPADKTATVTFVEFNDRAYAVTACHVICGFKKQAQAEGAYPESYFLPKAPGHMIHPPFLIPPQAFHERGQPDIALRPIDPRLPGHLSKKIYKVQNLEPEFPVPYAVASGYPTDLKRLVESLGGNRVELKGVSAVAEGVGSSSASDQLQFYSEVDAQSVTGDVNGMSGGPIFWSDGEKYGLLGFVKEAIAEPPEDSVLATVHFICQRATYEAFGRWAAFADENFQAESDALARLMEEQEKLPPR